MLRLVKHLLLAFIYGTLCTLLVLLGIYIYILESRSQLKPWHEVDLDAEFQADMTDSIKTLDDYRRLEQNLFQQLEEQLISNIDPDELSGPSRFNPDGNLYPDHFEINWNRTFELPVDHPTAGVLLLHGLSDSPYSMRSLGKALHEQGQWVVGLRIPGHGTAPSGLLDVTWQDFTAAVRIAVQHLRDKIGPDRPLYLVGYSNGAALAVNYALTTMEQNNLPSPQALVLISPAIQVAPVAAFAIWQARLSQLFGLDKMLWTDIQPEFDPYKYNSFTVNAGNQIYQLTNNIAERINRLAGPDGIRDFPATLAFVSVVDATIPPETLIDALFSKLAKNGHQLVLFDIKRHSETELLLKSDPKILTSRLLNNEILPFDLTFLSNTDTGTGEVMALRKTAGSTDIDRVNVNMNWPEHLFSLSHVALPFPENDPIYGGLSNTQDNRITLGNIWMRGERNLLEIPDNFFMRLRYNPFYSYLQQRSLDFLKADQPSAAVQTDEKKSENDKTELLPASIKQ